MRTCQNVTWSGNCSGRRAVLQQRSRESETPDVWAPELSGTFDSGPHFSRIAFVLPFFRNTVGFRLSSLSCLSPDAPGWGQYYTAPARMFSPVPAIPRLHGADVCLSALRNQCLVERRQKETVRGIGSGRLQVVSSSMKRFSAQERSMAQRISSTCMANAAEHRGSRPCSMASASSAIPSPRVIVP